MIRQFLILRVVTFFSPLLPPILVPLGYSLTGILLIQNANPRVLVIITVWAAAFADICIWIIQNHIIRKLIMYEQLESPHRFHRFAKEVNQYFKEQGSIRKLWVKREKYAETKRGKFMTFLFAIFCFFPIIPDIIGTRILYKKIAFPYFVIAVLIGKSVTHIPFIFLGKWVLQLLFARRW